LALMLLMADINNMKALMTRQPLALSERPRSPFF